MRHFRLIASAFALTLAMAANAAVGDMFTVGDVTLTVLTENTSTKTGTVSASAANTSISGDVVLSFSYDYNGINYSLTTIAKNGFKGCSKMTSIVIPKGVKTINDQAFWQCTSLATVDIPTTMSKINGNPFSNCEGLSRVNITDLGSWMNIKYDSSNQHHSPLSWAGHLYLNGEEITELSEEDFPEGITEIGDYVFQGMSGLQKVTFPSTLTKIGMGAFKDCDGIVSLHIPSNVKQVERAAFAYCDKLKDLVIDEGVEVLGMLPHIDRWDTWFHTSAPYEYFGSSAVYEGTFEGCNSLVEVTIPSSVTILSAFTFQYCESLQKVTLPETMKQIFRDAFRNCSNLTEVNLPDNIFWLDFNCFSGCKKLQVNKLPKSLTHLGQSAFWNCDGITSVVIPENVDTIYKNCFYGCDNLKDVKLNPSLKVIQEGVFEWCRQLESIELPAGLKEIGTDSYGGAFGGCDKIRLVKIPNSVDYIGPETFSECFSLTHVTLPTYLQYFGDFVFVDIDKKGKISEITFPKDVEVEETYIDFSLDEEVRPSFDHIFVMGDKIEDNMRTITSNKNTTLFVKKSVYDKRYPKGVYKNFKVDYKIPLSMTNAAGSPIEYKTLCRDFDVDLTHTNDNLPEGVEPLRAYLVEDVDGDLRMVFLNEIKYIPSRLKANVTDEDGNLYQGVDEYVGVILHGTPGYTYYYEMGEHDYTQGAEGQWLMDDAMEYSNANFEQNLMSGDANDDFYVYKTVEDEDNNEIVNYGLNAGKFKIYNKDGWLNYNKSYLQLPKDVSAAIEGDTDAEGNANLTFVFQNADGSTDKVSSIKFHQNAESDIFYNPYGQQVSKNTKGIVINNGRKFVNK